ncbi:MAG: MFS transporter [Candidatus Accumulibacter sp.]|jgi:predicted MFS family arabinose efflux permease|nr:MFS transporter [Accumulibacter sp.]
MKRRAPDHPAVLKITLVCLGVLLFAQILIGALSFSALDKLIADMNADRVEYIARRLQSNIENGLNMGKPLAQFFGLEGLLEDTLSRFGEISGVMVMLPDGEKIAAGGASIAEAEALRQAILPENGNTSAQKSGTIFRIARDQALFATLLRDANGTAQGVLLMRMRVDPGVLEGLLAQSLRILLIITLVATAGLAAIFRYLLPASCISGQGRWRFLAPILALSLAQGGYALHVVSSFRDAWLSAMRGNVEVLSADLARNLDRILGYGLDLNALRDVEAPFSRLARMSPVISVIELVDRDGKVLKRASAEGALSVEDGPRMSGMEEDGSAPFLKRALGGELRRPEARGHLVFHLNAAMIARGVQDRALDVVTVVIVSLVAAIEMLLLSSLLMARAPPRAESTLEPAPKSPLAPPPDDARPGRLARPIVFGFLLVWALPLGFLPIYTRGLMEAETALPPNLLLALPLALEMACGLLATLAAGSLADRRGWPFPTFSGLALFAPGMALTAAADSLSFLIAARCIVGLGYGLVWMGLQGFVATHASSRTRGRDMTDLIAGIFAGHLSGAVIGAMLMEQTGPRPVFVIGAVMTLLPFLGILVLMRPHLRASSTAAARRGAPSETFAPGASGASRWREALRLLGSPGFGWLLFSSVVPFSVIQVGLLSFALPLYLESIDIRAANVGRVLMLYGLCVVYVGPLMGRAVDRAGIAKKTWILWGGLLAGGSLFGLYVGESIIGAALAVMALALASCCLNAAQFPYMLALPEAQKYGLASATSLMRAADKLGQMAGPLIVGLLFGILSMPASFAVIGLVCLFVALPFALFAPRRA